MSALPRSGPRRKTHDGHYRYRGYWSEGGICRIRFYEAVGKPPVIVCSELDENDNTSVTNLAEYLAAEVVARYFPHRFEEAVPVVWIEHYPGRCDPRRQTRSRPQFDRVTFASWTPRPCRLGGIERRKLGEPDWRRLSPADVADLIDEPLE